MYAKWITYQGKQIVFFNYSLCKTHDDFKNTLEEGHKLILSSLNPVLVYSKYDNVEPPKDLVSRLNELGKLAKPKIKKKALTGISGSKKVYFNGYALISGQMSIMKAFENEQAALSWLVL